MTSSSFHWFVLGGGLSPYTLALWERVAERSGHEVTLAHVPRETTPDFAHETDSPASRIIELVPVQSISTIAGLGARCLRAPRAAIICMGHSPIYNVALSMVVRRIKPRSHRVMYMSDANGIALAERARRAPLFDTSQLRKRAVLATTFSTSLDLGFSNSLAHRMLGIGKGVDLPLLPIEFPTTMEPRLPEPLASLVRNLPRPRLLTVARLIQNKNLVEFAQAFAAAVGEGMPGSLTIVGDGPERPRLEAALDKVAGRVVLAGAIPFNSSRRLFGAFDGMVLPSTLEPWGIVIIEGLGWGVPVLSSRQCGAGISMALETGDAVKLCGTSREELKVGLLELVGNLDRHTTAAKLAAPMVRSKFDLTAVADALITLGNNG